MISVIHSIFDVAQLHLKLFIQILYLFLEPIIVLPFLLPNILLVSHKQLSFVFYVALLRSYVLTQEMIFLEKLILLF